MTDSKGKGRATENKDGTPENPASTTTETETSLLSRVAASASGLTRNAFASSNGGELNERAATALSGAGKGQSSTQSQGQSSWRDSSKLIPSSSHSSASGLRTQSAAHVQQSETEFSDFLDGIDTFVPSQDIGHAQGGDETRIFDQIWDQARPVPRSGNALPAPATVLEQEKQDGLEVLALLSSPNHHEQLQAPDEDVESYDWGLSAQQITELRAMTRELFPMSEPHGGVAIDSSLNLIPSSDGNDQMQWLVWAERWAEASKHYTDEVWGNLLPLVKEAQIEAEDILSGESQGEQPKALRRLNAILGQLQK